MDTLDRLLFGCLAVWFIDQCLGKFGIGGNVARIIQIAVLILAIIFVLVGWYINIGVK